MHILVIDAQGGGVGRQLITQIKAALPDADILAVGTNSSAAARLRQRWRLPLARQMPGGS